MNPAIKNTYPLKFKSPCLGDLKDLVFELSDNDARAFRKEYMNLLDLVNIEVDPGVIVDLE